jgi:nucleotide-binding universal stress UspA family protein
MDVDRTETVVVGVDGSPESRAALDYALKDADRRHGRLRVVAAAQLPEYWAMAYGMLAPPPVQEIVAQVRTAAQEMADDVASAHPDLAARVPITVEARAGGPAEVLMEASEGAELLVIGHRGRGAVVSAMLGSVGLQCMLHATCPVTVVRPVTAPPAATRQESGTVPAPA